MTVAKPRQGRRNRLAPTVLGSLLCLLPAAPVLAQSPSASAVAEAPGSGPPLPDIPPLPGLVLPAPNAAALQGLDRRLERLLVLEVDGPFDESADLGFLTAELESGIVAAVSQRLAELRDRLNGDAAVKLLEKARDKGQRALRQLKRGQKKADVPDGDWLVFLLAMDERGGELWRDAVSLYGMLRVLEGVGTTPAVREMIMSYSYFGELVRIDLQRALERLKDRSVAGLIEARKHDASRVRRWAERQLELMGKAIPGEAVSSTDAVVLADVLVAFGRVRDIDATRVILSYTNSDRLQLRQAARAAIGALGDASSWHLKDTYKALTGDKAPAGWDWERTAREIFRLHDTERLKMVYEMLDLGMKAMGAGDHAAAVAAFDQVLAMSPLFDRRQEMAPAYVSLGLKLTEEGKAEDALVALRKALRLAPASPDVGRIESAMTLIEARALVEAGTPDRFLIERAIALNPDNAEARELLGTVKTQAEERKKDSQRYVAATAVGLLATVAMVVLARRREESEPSPPAADPITPEPPDGETPTVPRLIDRDDLSER